MGLGSAFASFAGDLAGTVLTNRANKSIANKQMNFKRKCLILLINVLLRIWKQQV